MRALCGSILAAGAMIGLGLTALGIGTRYSYYAERGPNGDIMWLKLRDLDTPLSLILVVLLISLGIGLTVSFLGLMYHHLRRHHEHLLAHNGTVVRGEERSRLPV